ncbi:N-acetylmuramoyl-L-alanine amidase CwlD [Cohnella sp. GCM10027633]|uniref:N-acetylmuramoyl-L-alanine amidase CwlD n=1 Tax=unclassified Cohnella TaxID=2636738 RepID=UPI0036360658
MVVWMTRRGWTRLAIVALLIALTGAAFLSEMPTSRTWSHWSTPLAGKVIALDAGHGGADGGAVGREGEIEKDLNLAIVLYLRDYLQQAGAVTLLTREGDYDLASPDTKGYSRRKTEDLMKRVEELSGGKKIDLTISIHMNSMPSPQWSGAQTFFYPSNPDNQRLAAVIQSEIRESLGNTERIAKKAETIYLLKKLSMPTALVEVGFLSNPREANLLADEQYQRKVATAIYRGILRYASGETGKPVL